MEKVTPILYRKLTPIEYGKEFDRIEREIKQMDDIDFEIIINTDIPFYFDFMVNFQIPVHHEFKDYFKPTFEEFRNKPIYVQKSYYIHYLKNIFMFPNIMFQRN
ncbi:hypothetical protein [Epilithonimonas sp.]|uniref:hypothetical protein n=1 Tax=Epilithonimonas sp. TaxID=2894511 RepID=UPI002898745E|nr:hypothetical protein [Epilithonimonas sp.]